MDDVAVFSWLQPDDRTIFAELCAEAVPAVDEHVAPAETAAMRLGVALAAPLWGSVALAVSLARLLLGRRPLLLVHERTGLGRRRLHVPKIPTMCVPENHRRCGGLIETAGGPPIEGEVRGRIDRWLRASGLDELPQLTLVVSGSMRIVGPRPVTASELDVMIADGPVAIDRLCPGLLGVWQLLDRDAYTLEQRRTLDQWMVDHWSPALRRRILTIALGQTARRLVATP